MQGPGGFVIYLSMSAFSYYSSSALVLLVGEAELPAGYKKLKRSAASLTVQSGGMP